MGAEHGLYCVGCCWGLIVILFALGVMSLFWMAAIAGVIFAEKVLPYGLRLSRVFAVAFVVFGIWVAAAPSSVPGLTDPSQAPSMMQMNGHGHEYGALERDAGPPQWGWMRWEPRLSQARDKTARPQNGVAAPSLDWPRSTFHAYGSHVTGLISVRPECPRFPVLAGQSPR